MKSIWNSVIITNVHFPILPNIDKVLITNYFYSVPAFAGLVIAFFFSWTRFATTVSRSTLLWLYVHQSLTFLSTRQTRMKYSSCIFPFVFYTSFWLSASLVTSQDGFLIPLCIKAKQASQVYGIECHQDLITYLSCHFFWPFWQSASSFYHHDSCHTCKAILYGFSWTSNNRHSRSAQIMFKMWSELEIGYLKM